MDIKMFGLSTCSHCKAVKRLLDEKGLPYESVDVDLLEGEERRKTIDEVKKYNPRCSFPTTIIGSKVIVGYKEVQLEAALP